MLNKTEIKILNIILQNPGVDISNLSKLSGQKRTTLLYHLDNFESIGIIEKTKSGRKNIYFAANNSQLKKYFEEQKSKIDSLASDLLSVKTRGAKPPKKKLTLSFVNYYDLLDSDRKELEEYYNIKDFTKEELYLSSEEFVFRAKDSEVVVNNLATKIDQDILEGLPNIKYMHVTTHMYRYIDVNALKKNNIHFSHIGSEYRSHSLAEYALGQTFSLLRYVAEASDQMRAGVREFRYFRGELLKGKVAGILGTDHISRDFAAMLKNLGVEVMIYSEAKDDDPYDFGVSKFYDSEEILSRADIVYILGSDDVMNSLTINLDKKLLSQIKKPIYLISLSKHNYIDTETLRKLIYEGMIKGLALDYFTNLKDLGEKESIEKILYLPNVYITPDIGWYTDNSVNKLNEITTRNLVAYAQGNYDYLLF